MVSGVYEDTWGHVGTAGRALIAVPRPLETSALVLAGGKRPTLPKQGPRWYSTWSRNSDSMVTIAGNYVHSHGLRIPRTEVASVLSCKRT